ncbi:homeobox protein 2-like, partial [Stegodyphus dumicola]|uniref:homeobox protein 2-like n=1 Tax=Stegodyphus dumicola TaxID=202533 RepID=UPI0015AD3AEB
EIHQRTIISPDDPSFSNSFGEFPGKLTHYSSRSQKIVDKDEVKEISELKDGEISTETTRTHHHEEAFDDEVPEEEAEEGMVPERSAETSRTIQYYTDPQEFQNVSDRLQEESRRSRMQHHRQQNGELPAVAHRWVDDHFGGPKEIGNGPRSESARTKSGGNRITIEMSGHRSSPSDLSPRDTMIKDRSRESTLRSKNSSSGWRMEHSPSPPYPPSTPVHNNTLGRSTTSPFEVSSSSGSSRSKTPVKTFYLGEDNTYQRDHVNSWKKKSNHSLADAMSSTLSIGDSNSLGRSNLSGHYGERSDSFCRIPKNKVNEPLRYEVLSNGTLYSKISRVKTDKNVQVSMSDDDDDDDNDSTLKRSSHRERSLSPHRLSRSTLTLPRTVKVTHESPKSPYSTNSLSHSKYYKSTDSLHSPGYSSYYSSNDYGNTNSYRNSSSPIYNNASFHRDNRNHDVYRKSDWSNSNYNDTYSTNSRNRVHEVKINKKSSQDILTNGRSSKDKSSLSPNWYSSSSLKNRKFPTSPPESGYQSPFPPTPPSSPPPRVIKVLHSDHYGSSSSMSPPDSPIHTSTASIRKKSAYPSGSASRSKSSSDLRTAPLFAPESFSPLASPLKLKTVGDKKNDRQKFYRVKPGQDGQSVVVQVRDWNGR